MTPDDELGARVRNLAEQLDVARPEVPQRLASTRRRAPVAWIAAATLVAAACVAAFVAINDDGRPSVTSSTDSSVESSAVATTSAPPTNPPTSTVEPTMPTPLVAPLTHPVIELDGCTPTWARSSAGGRLIDRAFTVFSSEPISFQLIAEQGGSLTTPFAVVTRIFAGQRLDPTTSDRQINGLPARAFFNPNGAAEIRWSLPDGSEAYLRTDSIGEDELVELASSLVPRPTDAAVPGFDLPSSGAPRDLAVVDEAFGPFAAGPGASSECRFADGGWLTASVIDSRPLVDALVLLDRPAEELLAMVELDDGRMIVVTGRQDISVMAEAALASLREATPDEMAALLLEPRHGELTQPDIPFDTDLQDRLGSRVFSGWEELRDVTIAALRERLPPEIAARQNFEVDNLPDYGGQLVITMPSDDPGVVAEQWLIRYEPSVGPTSVKAVTHGIKCADGSVHPPFFTDCPPA